MPRATTSAAQSAFRTALAWEEYRTGSRLDTAASVGLPLWETTLSQELWLALATNPATRSRLRIRVYSQIEEGVNGADWAWSFTETGSSTLMPLLVQAKRLWDQGYAVNQAAGTITQAERLSKYAQQHGIPAVYAFYNPQSVAAGLAQDCPWESALCQLGGIAIADAHEVAAIASHSKRKSIKPTSTFPTSLGLSIAEVAWPLSCALCCGTSHSWPSGDFPAAVGEALKASSVVGTTRVDQQSPFVAGLREAVLELRESAGEAETEHWADEWPDRPRAAGAFLAEFGLSGLVSVDIETRN